MTLPLHKLNNDQNSQNFSPGSHIYPEPPEEIRHTNPQSGLLQMSAVASRHCPWPTTPPSKNPTGHTAEMALVYSGGHLPFHLGNCG